MTECLSFQAPVQLRKLFSTILLFCIPSDPFSLWNKFKEHLAEDYVVHKLSSDLNVSILSELSLNGCYDKCLLNINDLLADGGRSITDFEGFRMPTDDTRDNAFGYVDSLLSDHLILNAAASECPDPSLLPFNENQRIILEKILELTEQPHSAQSRIIFIDGPGGTGKTFLFNALLDSVRHKNDIAIAVAHNGTAATLLKGGRTAHSTFKIPIKVPKINNH